MRRSLLVILTAGSCLAAPAAASADDRIIAGLGTRFITTSLTIDQGERVTFVNQDLDVHDVSAQAGGTYDGRLFGSPFVDPGGSGPVEGVEHLTTGSYPFYCRLHPSMEGTLMVSSAGTPVPRPGGTPADKRAPAQVITRLKRQDVDQVYLLVRLDEAATLTVRTTVSLPGAARTIRFKTVKRSLAANDERKIRLRLSKRRKRAVKNALEDGERLRARVKLTAEDKAGNKSVERRKIRLVN